VGTTWELREPSEELARSYREQGLWDDRSLGMLLADAVAAIPSGEVRIWSDARPARASLDEAFDLARRFGRWLQERGVGEGDVVAFQLPNCLEAAVVFWGTALAGAVVTPIVHFYGEREVGFILEQSRPSVLVAQDDNWQHLVDAIDGCELVPVGDPGAEDSLLERLAAVEPLTEPVAIDPASPALLAYTSGTTASPKGVVHTSRSLGAEMRQLVSVDAPDRRAMLTGAPVGHAMGTCGGLLLPLVTGRSIHLIDRWVPETVLADMRDADLRFCGGSTYFLTSLLDAPGFGPEDVDHFRYTGLGGSSIPAAVGYRADDLGIRLTRCYGSTEHQTITYGRFDTERTKRIETDGYALPGVEMRIVDDEGNDCPPGTPGEILSRGPDLFAGYTDPALTRKVFDEDGWYHTGDVGVLDEDGWLTVLDRLQDIIIRGGENVSAAEVEEAVSAMGSVAEVALVAAPDERLGEHGCAFVRVAPGQPAPGLADVQEHLRGVGLAKQKWPEEIRVVDDFPRTPSGKIKKVVLRQQLRDEV